MIDSKRRIRAQQHALRLHGDARSVRKSSEHGTTLELHRSAAALDPVTATGTNGIHRSSTGVASR